MFAVASQLGLAVVALAFSWFIANLVRQSAGRLQLVQVPNERSSHTVPTPSGGGIGIAVVGTVSGLWLALTAPDAYLLVAVGTGVGAAIIGILDDRFDLPSRLRFLLHCAMVVILLFAVGPLPGIEMLGGTIPPALLFGLLAFCGVWWINLFNFMDGIDGIAGAQALFMALGSLLIGTTLGSGAVTPATSTWTFILSAAIVGFLLVNWQPAKIFMGDAGSNYLAVWLLAVMLYMIGGGALSYASASILGAMFIADATVTLVRRVLAGERWHSAHRNHAYQKLSRRWGSHSKVVLLYLAVNVVWLYPLAGLAQSVPSASWAAVSLAYLPIVVIMLLANAGKSEVSA